jgi:signal peptidase II
LKILSLIMKKIIISIVLVAFCIGCDQTTKSYVQTHLPKNTNYSYLGDTFRLYHTENNGAFLSLGSNWPESVRFWVLTVLPLISLVVIAFVIFMSNRNDWLTLIAFTLILGGGLSNMWDRITNDGYVIDFMNMGLGSLRTGIFNFADVFITIAFFLIIFDNLREHFFSKKSETNEAK